MVHAAINMCKYHPRKVSQYLKITPQSQKIAASNCTDGSSSPVRMGHLKPESTVRMGHA